MIKQALSPKQFEAVSGHLSSVSDRDHLHLIRSHLIEKTGTYRRFLVLVFNDDHHHALKGIPQWGVMYVMFRKTNDGWEFRGCDLRQWYDQYDLASAMYHQRQPESLHA